jgi:ribosomal protein S11
MIHQLIKGKPILLVNSLVSKNNLKKIYKTNISQVKKQIRQNISNAFTIKKSRIARRNLIKRSYYYRFILKKDKISSKRTLGLNTVQEFNYLEERDAYNGFQEKFRSAKTKKFNKERYHSFTFGNIYIAHRRRNTFISIFKQSSTGASLAFKASVGLTGFVGPKRSTNHGKERVAKLASSFLKAQKYTGVDLIFTNGIGRWFSFTIRGLFHYPIQLRHMYIPKRRSHGFTRRKKARRT